MSFIRRRRAPLPEADATENPEIVGRIGDWIPELEGPLTWLPAAPVDEYEAAAPDGAGTAPSARDARSAAGTD